MKKILVADDTKNIRNLLTTCLEVNGYTVVGASNGEEALNLFKRESFDLAFLDIKMPEISGTEVLRRIRKEGIAIPVIIMTAFATIKNAVECTKLGAVSYLQKPFTADKVSKVVKEIQDELENHDDTSKNIAMAKELMKTDKLDDAFDTLKRALSINPLCEEIYKLLGKTCEMKKKQEEAEKFYAIAKQLKIKSK